MPMIDVKFKDQPALHLLIDDTDIACQYYDLVKESYSKEVPIYRDSNRYTMEYMLSLAQTAKKVFGWDWMTDEYNLKNSTKFHKDLEVLLGKTGFETVPAEYDHILHELHYGLHILEHGNTGRNGWLQIEWYNDDGFELDPGFKFQQLMKFGDIKLQNPFVGHGPLQMYYEQDFINISQTCKFHTFVKPGINISIVNFPKITFVDEIIALFNQHDPAFVELHGEETIKYYTGYPVIGRVTNLDSLKQCLTEHILVLDSLSFED